MRSVAGLAGWLIGLLFGLLISLPDAIITHNYLPIVVLGAISGLIIGGLIHGLDNATFALIKLGEAISAVIKD